jgi:hypothetical protein
MRKRLLYTIEILYLAIGFACFYLEKRGLIGDWVTVVLAGLAIPFSLVFAALRPTKLHQVPLNLFWERYEKWQKGIAQNGEPGPPTECLFCGRTLSQCSWNKNQTYCGKCHCVWSAESVEYQANLRRKTSQVKISA